MPKINIYKVAPEVEQQDTRVTLGWAKDYGSVQLGVTHLRDGADRHREYGDDGHPNWQGWFMDLDRHQVNRLIRTLRQARDAAFGRDE